MQRVIEEGVLEMEIIVNPKVRDNPEVRGMGRLSLIPGFGWVHRTLHESVLDMESLSIPRLGRDHLQVQGREGEMMVLGPIETIVLSFPSARCTPAFGAHVWHKKVRTCASGISFRHVTQAM